LLCTIGTWQAALGFLGLHVGLHKCCACAQSMFATWALLLCQAIRLRRLWPPHRKWSLLHDTYDPSFWL